ncbi:hypothetical protein [Paenibacillus sp. ISL-20]|uniref:hypothetical protein n=1 Tax=Paenibacillus sp. ISL-20 TaxID=2819163 RepID=UPI001BE7DB46|nr:hypothetical protein [Paenibacillus sp. ISL-20]MBT2765587.1 hypothetical protein [Paenibacillus sp. ISL-20]
MKQNTILLSTIQPSEQETEAEVLYSIGETAQMIDSTVKTDRYYDEPFRMALSS